jgi:DNA-binding beta-propeller fold protein YncE
MQAKQSVDTFTLSEPGKKVRVRGYAVDPSQHFMALGIQTVKKLRDRFEIDPYQLALYDLTTHQVVKAIAPPGGENSPRFNLRFSPDGKLLYIFGRDVLILDASTLEQVDHWDMSLPIEPGMGAGSLGSQEDAYENPSFFTALFTIQDPVAERRIVGVGRVDLAKRSVDFIPIGPSPEDLRLSFAVSPDHKRGYILAQNIDDYQMWLVNIDTGTVDKKIPFDGRPRMAIQVSTSGQVLYIYEAGRTIDLYQASDFKYLRTITMDTDMPYSGFHVVPARRATGAAAR